MTHDAAGGQEGIVDPSKQLPLKFVCCDVFLRAYAIFRDGARRRHPSLYATKASGNASQRERENNGKSDGGEHGMEAFVTSALLSSHACEFDAGAAAIIHRHHFTFLNGKRCK